MQWKTKLKGNFGRKYGKRLQKPLRRRPQVESLEDRVTPVIGPLYIPPGIGAGAITNVLGTSMNLGGVASIDVGGSTGTGALMQDGTDILTAV